MPRAPKLVLVHWIDAAGDQDGEDVSPIDSLTIGYVIADEKDFLRIAGEIFTDGSYRNTTAIPKGMIQSMIQRPIILPGPFAGWRAKPSETSKATSKRK